MVENLHKMGKYGQKRVHQYEFRPKKSWFIWKNSKKKGTFRKCFPPFSIDISLETRGFCCSRFSISPYFRKLQGPPVFLDSIEYRLWTWWRHSKNRILNLLKRLKKKLLWSIRRFQSEHDAGYEGDAKVLPTEVREVDDKKFAAGSLKIGKNFAYFIV